MEKAYLNKNIVVIGDFVPAKFDKLFLVKNDIIKEDEFENDSVFLPEYAQVSTPNLYVQVNQDKVTINFKDPSFEFGSEKISKLFKDSEVKIIGLNFKKALILKDVSSTRDYFYFEQNKLNKYFDKNDSVYGYFVTKEFEGYRLTLNIKPLKLQKVGESEFHDALDFSFNFRFSDPDILLKLENVKQYEDLTEVIIDEYDRVD